MSTVEDILEEAATAKKWAVEKQDWLDNPAVAKRYEKDPDALRRRAGEADVMLRASDRLTHYAQILKQREAAA